MWISTIECLTPSEALKTDKVLDYDESNIVEALQDGVAIFEALNFMEPNLFEKT